MGAAVTAGRVQVSTEAFASGSRGMVQLVVHDPDEEVAQIRFHVTGPAGVRDAPQPPDRQPYWSLYEKDVVLDPAQATLVDPVLTLRDGSELWADAAILEPVRPAPPRPDVPAAALSSLDVRAAAGQLSVVAGMQGVWQWRSWARRGAWPTGDGTPGGAPLDEYLRVAGGAGESAYATAAEPGPWYVVALPYDALGRPGPRRTGSVEVVP